jgi:UDP-N-acetylglucosamine--N-acetylmuramyl-(pentapeptide) pyrophosphoryl-undecaprenol N-acetylglucosamine transferase
MFPACALFDAIRRRGHDVAVVTDARGNAFCEGIEKKVVVDTVRFSYKNLFGLIYYAISASLKFFRLWRGKRPDVIVGFGGVFTVIPLIIAKILGSKVIIYEQNAVVGKANKFLEKFADLKLSFFKLDGKWMETPAPVRSDFVCDIPYECDGIVKILVIGGSQGAASFSKIIPDALGMLNPEDRRHIEIIQQASYGDSEELSQIYASLGVKATLKNFLRDVATIMADSQLVICRSGASTLSELSVMGRPAILIPYPNASDNHQFHNAKRYEDKKAAWVLEEKDGISEKLGKIIHQILENRELLKIASFHMMNDSVSRVAENSFIKLVELVGNRLEIVRNEEIPH